MVFDSISRKTILIIVALILAAIYFIPVVLTGIPSQPGQPWQPPSLTPWVPKPPPPELMPPGIFFSSITDCQTGCNAVGFDTGACQWPWPLEATGTFLGDCYIEGSRHCGNPEQCDCYCWDLGEDEEPPPEDGDAICYSLCTLFGYDYGYERVTVCASNEITQPDAGGTSCCCGPTTEPEPPPSESVGWTACDAFRIAEEKPYYTLIDPIPESLVDACYDHAYPHCELIGKWLTTYDILEPDCCVWRCSE